MEVDASVGRVRHSGHLDARLQVGLTLVGLDAERGPSGERRNGSGEIMRRLDEGESFVVTRNGVPVGELTPVRRLRFVSAAAATQIFRAAPPIDADEFRRDLDTVAGQDIAPRG